MPGIARKGLDSAGAPIIGGSPSVFANNAAVARLGDAVTPHGRGKHAAPTLVKASPNVFANSIRVSRAGDAASCDDVVQPGSSNVKVN